ncbi:MAG TPA: hypothetical protein PLV72_02500 [Candidatus Magasanikbacteria bacterium]|nr:hypothetical protein [Candidatus Magasanikbacteria bacterium]
MNNDMTQAQRESAWALKLKKNLQTEKVLKNSSLSTAQEYTQLFEELTYFRPRLVEAIKNRDKEKIVKYFEIICNLRARIAINNLKRGQEQFGRLSESAVKIETKNFVKECYTLTLAINQILQP